MAKPSPQIVMPDRPAVEDLETRVVHAEANFFGQPSTSGFEAVQLTNEIGTRKGNRLPQGSPPADPRFSIVTPFRNARGRR